jgi:hypothetical protein
MNLASRPTSDFGQPESGHRIRYVEVVEIHGSGSQPVEVEQLFWNGTTYVKESIGFRVGDATLAGSVEVGDKFWVIWRNDSRRWEKISGSGSSGGFLEVVVDKADSGQDPGDPVPQAHLGTDGYRYFSATIVGGGDQYWIRYVDTERLNAHWWLAALGHHICLTTPFTFNPQDDATPSGPDDERPVVVLDAPEAEHWPGKATSDFTPCDPTTEPPTPGSGTVRIYKRNVAGNIESIDVVSGALTFCDRIIKSGETVNVLGWQNRYLVVPLLDNRVSIELGDPPVLLHDQWADTESAQEPVDSPDCAVDTLVTSFRNDSKDDRIIVETIDSDADPDDKKERLFLGRPGRFAIVEGSPLRVFDDHVTTGDYEAFLADQELSPELRQFQPVEIGYALTGEAFDCDAEIKWWTRKGTSSPGSFSACSSGGILYDSENECYYVDPDYIIETTLVYFEGDTLYVNDEPLTKVTINSVECEGSELYVEDGQLKLKLRLKSVEVYGIAGSTTDCILPIDGFGDCPEPA